VYRVAALVAGAIILRAIFAVIIIADLLIVAVGEEFFPAIFAGKYLFATILAIAVRRIW